MDHVSRQMIKEDEHLWLAGNILENHIMLCGDIMMVNRSQDVKWFYDNQHSIFMADCQQHI